MLLIKFSAGRQFSASKSASSPSAKPLGVQSISNAMINNHIVLLLILGLLQLQSLTAQVLRAELYCEKDSLPVMFAIITVVDSSDTVLSSTCSNEKGLFEINIIEDACCIKIHHLYFSELQLINLQQLFNDTVNLGKILMIKPLPYLNVQCVGISARKEKRRQKQLIRSYNRRIRKSKDLTTDLGYSMVKKIETPTENKHPERLRVFYLIDINEVIRN